MLHEMTRTATAGRAKLVRVESYDVALDLTRGDELFGSTSVIRFSCLRPGADSHAELQADTVHEIILNGRQLDPEQVCADGRIALADLGESNELRVMADFRCTGDGSALHRSVDPADGKVYLCTTASHSPCRKLASCSLMNSACSPPAQASCSSPCTPTNCRRDATPSELDTQG
jgi:aminopeptidase N